MTREAERYRNAVEGFLATEELMICRSSERFSHIPKAVKAVKSRTYPYHGTSQPASSATVIVIVRTMMLNDGAKATIRCGLTFSLKYQAMPGI